MDQIKLLRERKKKKENHGKILVTILSPVVS